MQGQINRFLQERHYGFLTYTDGELFFHELDATSLPKPIKRGDQCEFDIGDYKGKRKAINLRPLSEAVTDAK
jgi:cold shock CspA family protein